MDAGNMLKIREELRDITECCICNDIFIDPRMLPCIHSFCLKCLEQTQSMSLKIQKEITVSCPVCRQECIIPPEGFSGLQKNFFMERLVKMAAILNPTTHHPCELCLERNDSQPASVIASSTMYCSECHQKLCEDCCELHKKNKVSKTHRFMTLNNGIARHDIGLLETFAQNLCNIHEKNHLDSYCKDCNKVVCAWCFIENHQTHSWSSVDEILDDFRKQVGQNLCKLSGCLTDILRRRQELDSNRNKLLQTMQNLETKIIQTCDELKARMDEDTKSLLVELSSIKQKQLKDFENASNGVERHLATFESFVRYCDEIKTNGTASDICLALDDLNYRADELSAMHGYLMQQQIPLLMVSFQESSFSEVLNSKDQNLIGEICVDVIDSCSSRDSVSDEQMTSSFGESQQVPVSSQVMISAEPETVTAHKHSADNDCTAYRRTPVLIKTIRTSMSDLKDKPIWGVAILDQELFILTQKMSKIDVYTTDTFKFKRRIPATLDFINPRDIVSCNRNRCLYVIDWKEKFMQKEIVRLDPSGTVIRKWLTGDDKGLLSIANDGNIIVTVTTKQKLNEYSPEGQLVREVILSPDSSSPWHAVKLTNGNFVVSQDDDRLHTVSLVDCDGQTVRSFVREGDTNLKGSVHVVVDRGGTVLLADTFKNRVLLLGPDLHYKRLLVSKSCGLRCPVRMQLDESSGRLFLVDNEYDYFSRGKWSDGRILVFDVGPITEGNVCSTKSTRTLMKCTFSK